MNNSIQGPAIFLAQFAGSEPPFNSLEAIGRWAAGHGYVGVQIPTTAPQLFDLEADPHETRDLGLEREHVSILAEMEAELRKVVDPEAVDARAFADQERMIARHGGIEAIMARGDFGYTPAPGQTPVFG